MSDRIVITPAQQTEARVRALFGEPAPSATVHVTERRPTRASRQDGSNVWLPLAIARAMVAFAAALRERLGGTLCTREGAPLDGDAFLAMTEATLARLAALGFLPGDPITRGL